jgi:integrase
LIEGTYQSTAKKTWADFRVEYQEKILDGRDPQTRRISLNALDHFERIVGPKKMVAVKTAAVDAYRAGRRTEGGKKAGELVSPATVNKELRHLRAAFKKAHQWGYLPLVPSFGFEREPKRLPTYVSAEHFAAIYRACDRARMPDGLTFGAGDWWRALLVMAYMTGWRIGELLALRREDLDLDAGTAVTRAEDNKGGRDEQADWHPVVVSHLRKIPGFDSVVFPWNHNRRTLHAEFAKIQEAAGVCLPCASSHQHSRYCYVYGFHDLRRAFATMNADRLTRCRRSCGTRAT